MTLLTDARIRLAVLLVALGGLAAYAATSFGRHRTAGDLSGWCRQPSGAPSEMMLSGDLRGLALRTGLAVVGTGAPAAQGVAGPSVAFDDRPPTPASVAPVGGGYELRWAARGAAPGAGETVADVFPFSSTANAGYYTEQAGGTGCRTEATSHPVAAIRGARVVTWFGPQGHWQSDVFFARGRNAFRVSVVAAGTGARATAPAPPVAQATRLAQRVAK